MRKYSFGILMCLCLFTLPTLAQHEANSFYNQQIYTPQNPEDSSSQQMSSTNGVNANIPLPKVFPIPAKDYLNIQIDPHWLEADYLLSNAVRLPIQQGTLQNVDTQLNIYELPAGIYFLSIMLHGNSVKTYKIIKQ